MQLSIQRNFLLLVDNDPALRKLASPGEGPRTQFNFLVRIQFIFSQNPMTSLGSEESAFPSLSQIQLKQQPSSQDFKNFKVLFLLF